MVGVTYSYRERVSRIVRSWYVIQLEKQFNHLLNLLLFSTAVTHNSTFDFTRSVFDKGDSGLRRGQDGHAARMSQLQSTLYITRVKKALYRNTCGLMRSQKRHKFTVNATELFGE